MKSKSNKQKLASVIGTFNLTELTSVKTDDGRFRLVLFVLFNFLRPINNLSVIKRRVFAG